MIKDSEEGIRITSTAMNRISDCESNERLVEVDIDQFDGFKLVDGSRYRASFRLKLALDRDEPWLDILDANDNVIGTLPFIRRKTR